MHICWCPFGFALSVLEKVRSVYTCPSLLVIKRSQFWNPWATTSMADIPQCSSNKVAPSYLKLKRETPREWRKKRCSFTTLDRLYDPSDDSVLTSSIFSIVVLCCRYVFLGNDQRWWAWDELWQISVVILHYDWLFLHCTVFHFPYRSSTTGNVARKNSFYVHPHFLGPRPWLPWNWALHLQQHLLD